MPIVKGVSNHLAKGHSTKVISQKKSIYLQKIVMQVFKNLIEAKTLTTTNLNWQRKCRQQGQINQRAKTLLKIINDYLQEAHL